MYSLESSNSYQVRLGLSWTGVAVNIAIIAFQIVVRIIEFFRARREKKREEQNQRRTQVQQHVLNEDSRIQLRNGHEYDNSYSLNSVRYQIEPKKIRLKVAA